MFYLLDRLSLICTRELGQIFSTPPAYIVLLLFQALNGLFFCDILDSGAGANLSYIYRTMGIVMLLMVPAIAMGSFINEKKSGTVELLLTSPIRALDLTLGKFLAYLLFLALMVLTTLQYPFILSVFTEVDGGRVLAGSLGVFLLGVAVLSLALFTSALLEHQVAACLLA